MSLSIKVDKNALQDAINNLNTSLDTYIVNTTKNINDLEYTNEKIVTSIKEKMNTEVRSLQALLNSLEVDTETCCSNIQFILDTIIDLDEKYKDKMETKHTGALWWKNTIYQSEDDKVLQELVKEMKNEGLMTLCGIFTSTIMESPYDIGEFVPSGKKSREDWKNELIEKYKNEKDDNGNFKYTDDEAKKLAEFEMAKSEVGATGATILAGGVEYSALLEEKLKFIQDKSSKNKNPQKIDEPTKDSQDSGNSGESNVNRHRKDTSSTNNSVKNKPSTNNKPNDGGNNNTTGNKPSDGGNNNNIDTKPSDGGNNNNIDTKPSDGGNNNNTSNNPSDGDNNNNVDNKPDNDGDNSNTGNKPDNSGNNGNTVIPPENNTNNPGNHGGNSNPGQGNSNYNPGNSGNNSNYRPGNYNGGNNTSNTTPILGGGENNNASTTTPSAPDSDAGIIDNSGEGLDVISIDKTPSGKTPSTSSNDGGSVIPTILGVGVAGAAAVAGAKYIKDKKDKSNNYDDDYSTEEKDNSFSYISNYQEQNSENNGNYDAYTSNDNSYSNITETPTKYKAGNVNALVLDDTPAEIKIADDMSQTEQKEELE